MTRKNGGLRKIGRAKGLVIEVFIPPQPDQEFMRSEVGRLVTKGLQGFVNASGRLKITVEYMVER